MSFASSRRVSPTSCLSCQLWSRSCQERLLSCQVWLVFGQKWHFSLKPPAHGSRVLTFWLFIFTQRSLWKSATLKRSLKGHETSAPLLMVMNDAPCINSPTSLLCVCTLRNFNFQLKCLLELRRKIQEKQWQKNCLSLVLVEEGKL